jgi:hypothetical protein
MSTKLCFVLSPKLRYNALRVRIRIQATQTSAIIVFPSGCVTQNFCSIFAFSLSMEENKECHFVSSEYLHKRVSQLQETLTFNY